MRHLAYFTIKAALLSFAQSPVHAKDEFPVVLKPTSNWVIDFAEGQCNMARTFGTDEGGPEEDKHAVFFRQWAPSRSFAFSAAGSSFRKFKSRRATYVTFSDDREEFETLPFAGNNDSYGKSVIYSSLSIEGDRAADEENTDDDDTVYDGFPQLDVDMAASARFVSLRQGKRTVRLETGTLAEAFAVMNKCTQGLVKAWGLDVERHLTATRMPKMTNFDSVARRVAQKYPRQALNRGEQAILRVRVMVDETGKATDCFISEVTRTVRLDSPACRPLMQGTYTPALDKDGKPFASYFTTKITYII
ncbi:MAG: energy transducer TonB [Erythrobacter sp.]